MPIDLSSHGEDVSTVSQECMSRCTEEERKAAHMYSVLNATPSLDGKIEINGVVDSLMSKGILGSNGKAWMGFERKTLDSHEKKDRPSELLVDIFEVAKTKELCLEIYPDGEPILNVAGNQVRNGSDRDQSCHDISVVHEFSKRKFEEQVCYILHSRKTIMRLASSCRFGFNKETDHFVREWDSTVAICRFSFDGPNCCATASNDACETIQALSSRRKLGDHTVEVMRRGIEPFLDRKMKHLLWPSPPLDRSGRLHRQYYRSVSEDVSELVLFTANLSDLYAVLNDIEKILYYIHSCRGLLGDLGYAKLNLDNLRYELRAGTLDFMAIEAIERDYYFGVTDTADVEEKVKSQLLQEAEGKAVHIDELTNDDPPFFHNDLHDMESLFWISIWELFFYYDKTQPDIDEENVAARQTASYKLFPRYMTTEHRRDFLRSSKTFRKMLAWLHTSLTDVKGHLNFLRLHLHNRYRVFEGRFPEYTFESFRGVHATFREHFEFCRTYATGVELAPFKTTGLRGPKANTGGGGRPTQMPHTEPTPPAVPG